ncbi:MAG: hypothetical protein ABL911_09910, partial [Gallionella sp.]
MNRLTLNSVAIAFVVTTLSGCAAIDKILNFGEQSYEYRKEARDARQNKLRELQKNMSSAETKAITETCMKELNNQGQGAT